MNEAPRILERTARGAGRAALRALALLVLALLGAPVEAQNADGVLMGAEAAVTGGAVLATTREAAGAFYNPAGLAALEGATLQVSGSAYQLSSMRLERFVVTTLPWGRTSETVRTTSWSAVPAVAAYGYRPRSGLGLAVGIWVPAREEVAFVSTLRSAGPFVPGGAVTSAEYEQRLSLSQKQERTYVGAAAGLAVGRGVRAGLSAFVVHDRSEEFVDLFAIATTDSPIPEERGGTVSISQRGTPTRIAARFGAGLQWDVSRALTLAFAAKTAALELTRDGAVSTVISRTSLFPGADPSIGLEEVGSAPALAVEPWRLAAGGAVSLGAWSLRAEADWQAAESGRRAVVNGRLGVLHDYDADLRWGAGVFTDRSRARSDSGALDVDFYGVAAGLDYRPPQVRAARGGGGSWDVRGSVAVRYAAGFGKARSLEIDLLGAGAQAPGSATVRVHALSVTIGGFVQF